MWGRYYYFCAVFETLKRILGALLLGAYLLASTPASEVLKLPVLIEHYLEHQKEAPEMGFWEYLALHYLSGIEYDADYARDMQLPFKNISLASILLPALQPPCKEVWRARLPRECDLKLNLPPVLGCLRAPHLHLPAQPPEA